MNNKANAEIGHLILCNIRYVMWDDLQQELSKDLCRKFVRNIDHFMFYRETLPKSIDLIRNNKQFVIE